MIYCINPNCKNRLNPDSRSDCQVCNTSLLIQGRYRLLKPLRPLDIHTHTEIFEVEDFLGSPKILKVLKYQNQKLVEMLEREAETLQLLNHPSIPKVEIDGYFTFQLNNTTQELYCLVMEKIEGQNLEEWIEEHGRISQSLALNWLRQLIQILEYVHQNHFLHRDIKPSNVILRPDGTLVLIDFGTARQITYTYLGKIKNGSNFNLTSIISSGYTPHEQIDGYAIPQSDFYALGRTFVHLLTGISPAELPKDKMTGKLSWQNKAPQVSKPFKDFIDELIAFFPADRPLDTTVMLRYLTKRGLFLKSLIRVLNSAKFKYSLTALLFGAILSGILYRISYPLLGQYYFEKGLEEQKNNNLDQAWRNYERAIKYTPKMSNIYNNMGMICYSKQDLKCAEDCYQKAIEIDPANGILRYNLGGVYDDIGNFKKAEVQYELARQSSNAKIATYATTDLARLNILQQKPAAAIDLVLQGLKQAEKSQVRAALYKNLGWALWMQTNYAEAEANLRKAIEIYPKRTDSYCLLAQVLEAQNSQREALAAWKDCLNSELIINSWEVKLWRTTAYQRLKDAGELK